jgi:tRNA(Ile)-lysidine synthase
VTDLLQRVEENIQRRQLLKRGQKILVAVSGGMDSLALLGVLLALAKKWRWKITVAHFNHQLRGRASEADEKLVRQTAATLNLPIVVERADVKRFAAQSKLSIEMAARKLRHEFFSRVAKQQKISVVALAHHADDQVELFFLRLLRGAGGEGLAGMKWSAPSPADKQIRLVRPLLDLNKGELREFVLENKIRFRHDATNFSLDAKRNRIRNELLPLLRKNYQPGLSKTILRLMEILGAESDLVGAAAQSAVSSLRFDAVRPQAERCIFGDLPVAIQRRVLQSQLAEIGVAADFELIESLRQSADCFVSVGPNISVSRDAGGRVFLRVEEISEFNDGELTVELRGRAGEVFFGGRRFSWQLTAVTVERGYRRAGSRGRSPHQIQNEIFDADKVGSDVFLRHWRPGDRFQPIGLKASVKLQDLFTNAKIPRERRRNLILAATATGGIFWVEGLRIGEQFKLTPQTRRQLAWHWSNLPA